MFARRSVALAVLVLGFGGMTSRAAAAVFMVGDTHDAVDAAPGDGVCATAGGGCSLRAAVQEANALAGGDTIMVPAGTFTLSLAGANEDDAASGDLDLRETVEVVGAGAGTTIVDADGLDRVFDVWVSASIRGLTIRGGDATMGAGGFRDGGAILVLPNAGPVVVDVDGVRISGNTANAGGGIAVGTAARVNLTRSSVSGNTATSGGGIDVSSDASGLGLTNVTVSGNTAGFDAGLRLLVDAEALHVTLADGAVGVGDGATFTVTASIVGPGSGCSGLGSVVSGGANVDAGSTCGFGGTDDASGSDPMLGALGDHGGGTLTHALTPDSPAIDRVSGACQVAVDQRDVARPIDGDGDATARCDAGAYEFDPADEGCGVAGSLPSLGCRLDELTQGLLGAGDPGAPLDTTVSKLVRAAQKLGDAAAAVDAAKAGKAKRAVKKASALVKKVGKRLGSAKKGPKIVASEVSRVALAAEATTLADDIRAFRDQL